jgi:hypothetical protein
MVRLYATVIPASLVMALIVKILMSVVDHTTVMQTPTARTITDHTIVLARTVSKATERIAMISMNVSRKIFVTVMPNVLTLKVPTIVPVCLATMEMEPIVKT